MNHHTHDFGFAKALVLSTIFFTVTPIAIISSLASLFFLSYPSQKETSFLDKLRTDNTVQTQIYSSEESSGQVLGISVEAADARSKLLENYFEKYNSKLIAYAPLFVEVADKYYLDYRLIPAIAQQESNLCKIIPDESYNCWGWGIHSKGTLRFKSFDEAIETIAKGLKKDYVDKGYNTVDKIMTKYTPSSPGTWAAGVNQFMYDIENPSN